MNQNQPPPVTELLVRWRDGDPEALDELLPIVYEELHRIAARLMRSERSNHTLQPTALIHEAFGRLVGAEIAWQDRTHFYAISARTMRRVLVDYANARASKKRGGGAIRITMHDSFRTASPSEDLLALDQLLERLADQDRRKSELVELHYFGGLSYQELAEALELSLATVHRELRLAKAWLYRELKSDETDAGPAASELSD